MQNLKGGTIMVRVSLSNLENARTNPAAFARSLVGNKNSGGIHGFVSKFKTVIRDFHEHDRDFKQSLRTLDEKLEAAFQPTSKNNVKRRLFCESYEAYNRQFQELGLSVDCFQRNIDWQLIRQAKITGVSPFLMSNDEYNVAYFFSEHFGNWQEELKYPLLQIYLAEYFYKCDVDKVKIGVYSVHNKVFDLKTYEDFELDNALEEGKSVLGEVANAYGRFSIS